MEMSVNGNGAISQKNFKLTFRKYHYYFYTNM